MIKIDAGARTPIHEQIKNRLKELVLKGMLKPGDALPTAAAMAEALLVAPAAVNRAFRELLKEGFLLEQQDGGIRISRMAEKQSRRSITEALQEAIEALRVCHDAGVDWEQIEVLIRMLKKDEGASGLLSSIAETVHHFPVAPRSTGACPFCKQPVGDDDRTATCIVCGTVHHVECWNETARCSIFGCSGRVKIPF